jgi:hypothetical protein
MTPVHAQVNAEALLLSCCALAMDGNYVQCSGWLRKSPPEKKLTFCVSVGKGHMVNSLGSQRGQDGASGGPRWQKGVRVASSHLGNMVPSSSGFRRGHRQGGKRPAEVRAACPSPWGTVTSSSPDTLPEH